MSATSTPARRCFCARIRPQRKAHSLSRPGERTAGASDTHRAETLAIKAGGTRRCATTAAPTVRRAISASACTSTSARDGRAVALPRADTRIHPGPAVHLPFARPARAEIEPPLHEQANHHPPVRVRSGDGSADPCGAWVPTDWKRKRTCILFQALAQAIAHQQLNGTAAKTILGRLIPQLRLRRLPDPPRDHPRAGGQPARGGVLLLQGRSAEGPGAEKTLANIVPGRGNASCNQATMRSWSGSSRCAASARLDGGDAADVPPPARPDVLPVDDLRVRAGFQAAYGLSRMPHPKLRCWPGLGERWRPLRSAAAWYLWRARSTSSCEAAACRHPRMPPACRAWPGAAGRMKAALKKRARPGARKAAAEENTGEHRNAAARARCR